jgi:poly(3-hydroxybutyrate) depolymerase
MLATVSDSMFLYPFLDLQNWALAPWNTAARASLMALTTPLMLPFSTAPFMMPLLSGIDFFEKYSRRSSKPSFGIHQTVFRGETVRIKEEVILSHPFYTIKHFKRVINEEKVADHISLHIQQDPKVLIVTPMSGHFSTLMRGTVEALLPSHNVYITDWVDAKLVPLSDGYFDLEDQIECVLKAIKAIGPDTHIIGISQASLTVFCAVSLLAQDDGPHQPRSITLIGGPIDARKNASLLSEKARTMSLSDIRLAHMQMVPSYYAGAMRPVYPGPLQLLDRMSMTLDRHVTEQAKYFQHLVRGDDDDAEAHTKFYDEFLAVMDVPEEFYIQFVERAYQRHDLPNGSFTFRGRRVDPSAITKTALLTVEGELDDLSPAGQTRAAHDLCPRLPAHMKQAYLEINVGHYGVFSGRKWRNNIQPAIHNFIRAHCPVTTEVDMAS